MCERRGGRGRAIVACLSNLTIDHATISRWSTVPPDRNTSNIWVLGTFPPSIAFRFFLVFLSCLSCLAVCGHPLSTR